MSIGDMNPDELQSEGDQMNRQQAAHILDAYVCMRIRNEFEEDTINALREVILDAMTNYQATTVPSITWPNTQPLTVPTYKPIITCGS